jgi:hypothetical protein
VVRGDAREVLSWEELPQAPATLPPPAPPPKLGKSSAPGSGGSGALSSYSSSAQLRLAVLPDAADPGRWPVEVTPAHVALSSSWVCCLQGVWDRLYYESSRLACSQRPLGFAVLRTNTFTR